MPAPAGKPFVWENATAYFLLTDRFNNGNPANDHAYGRKDEAAKLRGHAHPAVAAGVHQALQYSPYTFKRTWQKDGITDRVVIALDLPLDKPATISVAGVFNDGQTVRDGYSGQTAVVANGKVRFDAHDRAVLISQD